MLIRDIEVKNKQGIHVRPASLIAEASKKFHSVIIIHCNEKSVDATNIMALIALNIMPNTTIRIEVCGADEQEAIETISKIFAIESL